MNLLCVDDIPELPASSIQSHINHYNAHIGMLDPITGEHVEYLDAGLPPSKKDLLIANKHAEHPDFGLTRSERELLIREYYDIVEFLAPYKRLLLLFKLIHKQPLLAKRGERAQYKKSIKTFELQPEFAALPSDWVERIHAFHLRAVKSRPLFSVGQKVLIGTLIAALGGLVVYGVLSRKEALKLGPLQDSQYMVDGNVDVNKIMPLLLPDKINRFKKKENGYTRVSFNQENMAIVLKDLKSVVCNLLQQNVDGAELLKQKIARGEPISFETDPLVQDLVQRLLAVGRVCMYLEAYDRTLLKKAILCDAAALSLLLQSIDCPFADEIFDKVSTELGIKETPKYSEIKYAFSIMRKGTLFIVSAVMRNLTGAILSDGPADALRNNEPDTWNDGVKPYDLSGVTEQ